MSTNRSYTDHQNDFQQKIVKLTEADGDTEGATLFQIENKFTQESFNIMKRNRWIIFLTLIFVNLTKIDFGSNKLLNAVVIFGKR